MIKEVEKPEKVALCRVCHGTGKVKIPGTSCSAICQQCEGSGRVYVSCTMTLEIRAFKNKV